jgi:hypothetical protein
MTRLNQNLQFLDHKGKTLALVEKEVSQGINILNDIRQPIVTFLGSHKTKKDDHFYIHAHDTAYALGKAGYAILTGGGPGIMEAANQGGLDASVPSIGFKAGLIKNEEVEPDQFTDSYSFSFLFTRRFFLGIKCEAFVVYPGAYGTFNEMFEYLTLIQAKLVDKVPVICVGREFWEGLFEWFKTSPLHEGYFVDGKNDLSIITLVDTVEEVLEAVR